MIVNKFDYVKLERETLPTGVRYYICPTGEKVASVTTILSAYSDKKQILEEWEQRIGTKKANEERKFAADLGTLLHTHLENHILGVERPRGNNLIRMQSRRMADRVIEHGLSSVDEYWGVEVALYCTGLYAGTTDVVGVYDGIPSIMDFKNAKKMRSKDMITDYFEQLAAYAIAHNDIYGTNIDQGVIFMVSRDEEFEKFVINGDEFQSHKDNFLKKVERYLEENNG